MLSPTNCAASDSDCAGVGDGPSSLEAASSQTWASCRRGTRTSSSCASRAHLKHSSAIARYSAAVFIGIPSADLLHVFPSLSALSPTQQRNYVRPCCPGGTCARADRTIVVNPGAIG